MLCQIKLAVVYANLMRSIWRIQNGDSCHKGLEVVRFARGLSGNYSVSDDPIFDLICHQWAEATFDFSPAKKDIIVNDQEVIVSRMYTHDLLYQVVRRPEYGSSDPGID